MLVQKFLRQLSTLSTIKLFPEPTIRFFQKFVQRRWVYSVVETTSYVKIKKSETYRKEFRNQTDELKRRNILKKESHLLHKTKTDDKTKKPLSYTPFVQLAFCPTKPSFYPLLVNKPPPYSSIVLTLSCSLPLLFKASFVLLFYCSAHLLFYTLLFNTSVVLTSYCLNLPLF